jgi:hypothetical protein|eukprot:evm.model.NODE_661_length_26737_cov_29.280697.6
MDAPSRGNYDPESGEHYFHRDKRDFYDEDDKHKKRRSQTLPLALKWTVVVCLGWGIVMMTLGLSGVGTGGTQAGSVSTLTPGSRLVEQGLEKQKPKELQRREHRSKQEGERGENQQQEHLSLPPAESEQPSASERQTQKEGAAQPQLDMDEDEVRRAQQEQQIAKQQDHKGEDQQPTFEQAPHQASGDSRRRKEVESVNAEIEDLKSSWEDRMSSGRELLLTGIDMALQELMATRGLRLLSNVSEAEEPPPSTTPDFTEAVEVVGKAVTMFSKSYTGEVEIIERDYVGAMTMLALLRLHQGQFDEVHKLVDEAKTRIDLDPDENGTLMLLEGYAHEAQGSDKAGMFFTLAREYDPEGCHETLLDASYQPPAYQLSVRMPSESPAYWPALVDLLLFRELYARRMLMSPAATWPGTVWSTTPQNDKDEYGANLGWGFNWPGLAKAASLLKDHNFVVLREFLHPFELAVLERHYKGKVQSDQLAFDDDLGRATSYQDRVGHWLNHRHTELLSSLAGRSVKHAYSFLCHYERRDGVTPQLRPHTDREDNEVRSG